MRFSIWPANTRSWDGILDITRHCEAAGWHGVWIADHFMFNTGDESRDDTPMMECWSILAALATETERLRLGPLVTSISYRHPAVLANIAAAVDCISHGRLVLGVGAGWQINEHAAYGIDLLPVRERIDRFEEAVQTVLSLLREPRANFDGDYYTVTDAPNEPKPVQDRLPLLIGAKGERRTMRIAARHADEWNAWTTPDEMRHKLAVLHRHCEDLKRDPKEITVSTQALLCLSTDESWLARMREREMGLPTIVGTPGEVTEIVAAYRDAGVDELILPDWTMGSVQETKDTYDLFLEEVVGAL